MSTGSSPPDLPSFEYQRILGSGGFADVFLYRQLRPEREVAVKVLRTASLDAADLRAFDAEANLMAKVSDHPFIVSIHGADVAPDGRPYLVMEYYALPNFSQRLKAGPLPVHEVLRVGVRIASAVETAHRAGILHRDIKPENILVNGYGRPGLTDFGIAGVRDGALIAESQGLTLAYAPPEAHADDAQVDEVGDVYSLGATLYALLAGRSPFVVPGAPNDAQAMLGRVLRTPVPPLERPDAPQSLDLLLRQTLAKAPAHRPQSAAALGRALQGIERELGLDPTDFELVEAMPEARLADGDDADSTRAGRIQVIRPSVSPSAAGAPAPATRARPPVVAPTPQVAVPKAPPASDTVHRPVRRITDEAQPAGEEEERPRPSAPFVGAVVGGVVALILVATVVLSSGGGGSHEEPTTTTSGESVLVVEQAPAMPTRLEAAVEGGVVTLTWELSDGEAPEQYGVRRTDRPDPTLEAQAFDGPPVTVEGIAEGDRACFAVRPVSRGRGTTGEATVCTP